MYNRPLPLLVLIPALCTTPVAIAGKMYQCRSADGSVEFSNVACSDAQADRATVMHLEKRQPGERSSSDLVERAERFSAQRRYWAAQEGRGQPSATRQPGSQPLTYGQRQAIKNANTGRPEYDSRLTPAQNAAAANAHNAKARGILSGAGLNPNDYLTDQPIRPQPSTSGTTANLHDPYSGRTLPRSGAGFIDPATGTFYHEVGGGVVNTKTGEFIPTH